ncbi:hypothetical protein D3C71_2121600 [compost metagenome]
MSKMQAAGRVRADKLHLHLFAFACLNPAIIVALLCDKTDDRIKVALGEREVDEARTGDLRFFNRG